MSIGARWKIESGFKELKQEIGSRTSQCRNALAVTNHLNFCMMATTVTWIYADRLKANPERRHKVKGRTGFAFSDVRRIISQAALNPDFHRVCPKPSNPPVNSLVAVLLRMVAYEFLGNFSNNKHQAFVKDVVQSARSLLHAD